MNNSHRPVASSNKQTKFSPNFHEDSAIRIDNQRHAGIVVKDGAILLMQRKRKSYKYWVLPGGHARVGEIPAEVAMREIEEETSIIVENPRMAFVFHDYLNDNNDYYYFCNYVSGTPTLGGEEAEKNSPQNFFKPQWVKLHNIGKLNILPKYAKYWLSENLQKL